VETIKVHYLYILDYRLSFCIVFGVGGVVISVVVFYVWGLLSW
jgi:hypothetical protein